MQEILNEISLLRSLNHPNITNLLAVKATQSNAELGFCSFFIAFPESLRCPYICGSHGNVHSRFAGQAVQSPTWHRSQFGQTDGFTWCCVLWVLDLLISLFIFLWKLYGVKYLHDNGIVHRDLKPGNVLLTCTPQMPLLVKVADFGTCKVILIYM